MYVSIYLSIYLSIYISTYLSIYACVCIMCMYMPICICVCVCVCTFSNVFIYEYVSFRTSVPVQVCHGLLLKTSNSYLSIDLSAFVLSFSTL